MINIRSAVQFRTCPAGHRTAYRLCLQCEDAILSARIVRSEPVRPLGSWRKTKAKPETIADLALETPLSDGEKSRARRIADKLNAKALANMAAKEKKDRAARREARKAI